tara:strand:- start:254 stop:436 length:183 start_codon:yes stop_codon:yes gene_type:complete
MPMTIYDYFNALTNIDLGVMHTEEFEDAINDTLAMIQQSTLGDIENKIEEEEEDYIGDEW